MSVNTYLSKRRSLGRDRAAGVAAAEYGAGASDVLGAAAFASSGVSASSSAAAAGGGGGGAGGVKSSSATSGSGAAAAGAANGTWQPSRIDLARSYM